MRFSEQWSIDLIGLLFNKYNKFRIALLSFGLKIQSTAPPDVESCFCIVKKCVVSYDITNKRK